MCATFLAFEPHNTPSGLKGFTGSRLRSLETCQPSLSGDVLIIVAALHFQGGGILGGENP